MFTTEVFKPPKGLLFYGPPGTGKSYISRFLCEKMGIVLVCPPLAAGDFNRGLVGDSERMVNALAERAKLIPWELCVMLIDEIDSLAPNRMESSG